MASSVPLSPRERTVLPIALGLALSGAAAGAAWAHGFWLALSGAILLVGWLAALNLLIVRRTPVTQPAAASATEREATIHRLLLDAAPTPLVSVTDGVVHALNQAARALFATDDRVLPTPPPLLDRHASHLRHAGRSWRADRVAMGGSDVVALIDVEGEERTAEARASAEMIRVLGHELLNGLVPIVSLAECGVVAADPHGGDPALLPEILATLARRAEGLQRFAEAYRTLARLPPPLKQIVSVQALIDDLSRLFSSRWPEISLATCVEPGSQAALDRDQLNQALWALLQNAVEASGGDPTRPVMVRLSARRHDAELVIEVADDGPGVAPDQMTSIFRPFHTTKVAGTGIGLSLARQIAQAHGGTLTLIPARPTIFRMQVPAVDSLSAPTTLSI